MDQRGGGSYQHGDGPLAAGDAEQLPGGEKIKELQNDVNQLTSVMQTNINKVLERGDRMDTLNERSELLSSRANEFRINSRTIRRKFWWQNLRFQIVIGLVILSVIIVVIYSLAH